MVFVRHRNELQKGDIELPLFCPSALVPLFLLNFSRKYGDQHHGKIINPLQHTYCLVPAGLVLHKTAMAPGSDETRSLNPLVRTQVD